MKIRYYSYTRPLGTILRTVNFDQYEFIIATDVSSRDGIGIEIWKDNQLLFDIFRDDSKKTKVVTIYNGPVPVDLMEESIKRFKKEIPHDFID